MVNLWLDGIDLKTSVNVLHAEQAGQLGKVVGYGGQLDSLQHVCSDGVRNDGLVAHGQRQNGQDANQHKYQGIIAFESKGHVFLFSSIP